jgi:hypothetical protein
VTVSIANDTDQDEELKERWVPKDPKASNKRQMHAKNIINFHI